MYTGLVDLPTSAVLIVRLEVYNILLFHMLGLFP